MPLAPYIGITGITGIEQADALAAAARRLGLPTKTGHELMAGYLVSSGTILGKPSSPRYPPFADLRGLLERTAGTALNVIHYRTNNRESLADQIMFLFQGLYDEGLCRALQLNMVWPTKEQVAEIARRLPELKITLCLTRRSFGTSPRATAANLAHYLRFGPCVHRVLLDPSGGRGRAFVLADLMGFYDRVRQYLPEVAVGFAGGLCADNVADSLAELIRVTGTTDVSIDAEGGLRVPRSPRPWDDDLALDEALAYLEQARRVLEGVTAGSAGA